MSGRVERVWRQVDAGRLRQTLRELLDIYSPSGKEEDAQLYLEALLSRAGLPVERQEVEAERFNLLVPLGEKEPALYLVGHVDTVAAWDLEAYGARLAGDAVFGLGSADMKGGCAAMVEAALALAALPPGERPAAGLLFVVGEEENGDGSAAFLQRHRPDWVVIGEPTGLAPCLAHFGYLEVALATSGRRSHSSLPELGHNAVEAMLRLLLHLGRDPLFDRGRSELVYSIRELSSSQAGFVVPDRCETRIDLHLPPPTAPAAVEAAIRGLLAAAERTIPGLRLEADFPFAAPGYDLGVDNAAARALTRIYPRLGRPLAFDTFRSHSDGNLFFAAGVRPLILGPGSLETAHTPEERTSLAEVTAAARLYAALCLELAPLNPPSRSASGRRCSSGGERRSGRPNPREWSPAAPCRAPGCRR